MNGVDLGQMYTRIEADTRGLNKAETGIRGFSSRAAGLIAGITAAATAAAVAIGKVTMPAARYETLGTVMMTVGKNAGYSADEIKRYEEQVRASGISMIKTRETVTKMAQAQIDLSQSSNLARIAQDAAVIGNIDSSEAFGRLIHGIQSAQTEVLRNIGINANFEASYKRMAEQLGKNTSDLTEYEKTQARVNEVLGQGERIAGSYEAAMETAGKKWGSLSRQFSDFAVQSGQLFTPAFGEIVDAVTRNMKDLNAAMADSKEIKFWGEVLGDVTHLMFNFSAELDKLKGKVDDGSWVSNPFLVFLNNAKNQATGGPIFGSFKQAMDLMEGISKKTGLQTYLDKAEDGMINLYHAAKRAMTPLDVQVERTKAEVKAEGYVDSWLKAANKLDEAQKKMGENTGVNLEDIKKKYDEHAKEIKRISDEIAQNQQSGAELLRSLQRTGMSEYNAWRDMKAEAKEYEQAAREAAKAGDFSRAIELADKAQDRYVDLNKEVKEGSKTMVSAKTGLNEAIAGTKRMIALRDEALKSQKQIEIDSANALAKQAGPEEALATFESIKKSAEELREQTIVKLGDEYTAVWTEGQTAAQSSINDTVMSMGDLYNAIDKAVSRWEDMEDVDVPSGATGRSSGGAIRRAAGGAIGWARAQAGRYFPGYGGGDKIRILGEAGEFMLRKEAVREGSQEAARAFNNRDWPKLMEIIGQKLRLGGPVSTPWPSLALASGGSVGSLPDNSQSARTETPRNYYVDGDSEPIRIKADERNAQRMMNALQRRNRRRI